MHRLLAVVLLVAACTPAPTPTTTITTITTTTSATSEVGEVPACLQGTGPYQQEGNAGATSSRQSDATVLFGVDWQVYDECEQLVLRLSTTEGAPPVRSPGMTSFFLRDAGVVRIVLGDSVTDTNLAEQLVDTALIERLYVVRSLTGPLFVDLHLAAPAFVRVTTVDGPGRIVVDLQPGGPPFARRPLRSDDVVVVEPADPALAYPFSVTGYVRTRNDRVTATITSLSDGSTVSATGIVPTQDDAWGSFGLLFQQGPTGRVLVDVAGVVDFEATAG